MCVAAFWKNFNFTEFFCIRNSPKITGYRIAYFVKVRDFKGYFAIN